MRTKKAVFFRQKFGARASHARGLRQGAVAALTMLGVGATGCGVSSQASNLQSASSQVKRAPQMMRSADYDYGAEAKGLTAVADPSAEFHEQELNASGGFFVLPRYDMPVPYQYNAGSCLYMTATGIMEWLINQQRGVKSLRMEGRTDLSERYTMTLAGTYGLENSFTDVVDLFKERGGYILASELPFTATLNGRSVDTKINWTMVSEDDLTVRSDIPDYRKQVIFSSDGDQNANGVMEAKDIAAIKAALRTNRGPVLFIYHPPRANWWHANMLIGYNDAKQVFYARDSAFGGDRRDLTKYHYGTKTRADDHYYSGVFAMPYSQAKAWGNHATSYYLP